MVKLKKNKYFILLVLILMPMLVSATIKNMSITFQPNEINMTDGCSGAIGFMPDSDNSFQICANDGITNYGCVNYISGEFNSSTNLSTNYFIGNTTKNYRLYLDWNRIKYIDMNDSGLNGYNDSNLSANNPSYDMCYANDDATTDCSVEGYTDDSVHDNAMVISASDNCVGRLSGINVHPLYSDGTCSSIISNVITYIAEPTTSSCRIYEGYTRTGNNATVGGCVEALTYRHSTFGCSCSAGNGGHVGTSCNSGTIGSCPSSLCSYAGDYNDSSNYFTITDSNTSFNDKIISNGTIYYNTIPPLMISTVIIGSEYNDSLVGKCNATTEGNESVKYNYIWYKNNVTYSSGITGYFTQGVQQTVNTITEDKVKYNDTWILSCSAQDSYENSTWLNSSTTTIVDNFVPVIGSISHESGASYYSNYIKGSAVIYRSVISEPANASGLNTSSCQYSINGGSNWFTGVYSAGYCKTPSLNLVNANSYNFNLQVRDNEKNQATGVATGEYICDESPPSMATTSLSSFSTYSSYIKGTGTVYSTVSDSGSGVNQTSCQYTNGSSYASASYSGGQCQQEITIQNTATYKWNFTVNDSLYNQNTSISTSSYTGDTASPSTTDNFNNDWRATNFTGTLSPTDSGSGIDYTQYCIDSANSCTPDTTGTSVTVSCPDGNVCLNSTRYRSIDNLGNTESVQSSVQTRIDKKSPTVGTSTLSSFSIYGSYIKGTGDIEATVSDTGSGLNQTSCQYYIDGSSWLAGSYSSGKCQKTSIAITNGISYTFNLRLKDNVSNLGAGTPSSTYTGDTASPNTTDNFNTIWRLTNFTGTLSPTDAGSGIDYTQYCIDSANSCTPDTTGTNVEVLCPNNSVCKNYTRYRSIDNLANTESVQSSVQIKIDKQKPNTTVTGNISADLYTFGIRTNSTYVNISISCDDNSGIGCNKTLLCIDTLNTCTPIINSTENFNFSIEGTSYIRYYSNDSLNNIESIKNLTIIINSKPILDSYNFYPVPNDGLSDINFNLTLTDADNDTIYNWTQWFKNGVYNDSWDNLFTIGADNFTYTDNLIMSLLKGDDNINDTWANYTFSMSDDNPPIISGINTSATAISINAIEYLYANCSDAVSSVQKVEFYITDPLDNEVIYQVTSPYSGNTYRKPVLFNIYGNWSFTNVSCSDTNGNSVINSSVNTTLTVSNPPSSSNGGGGGSSSKTCNNSGYHWDIRTLYGQLSYNTAIPYKNAVKVKRELSFINYGNLETKISLLCQDTDDNVINICDYVSFTNDTLILPPNSQEERIINMLIEYPPEATTEDEFSWNVIANDGNYCSYSLENKAYISRFSFTKWRSFESSDGNKIVYPAIIPSFILWVIIFLLGFWYYKKTDSAFIGIFAIGLMLGAVTFSITLWL